jgi:hypothetical protein
MNDRPTAAELIDAVRRCLETELAPALADPRLRYQALVAAHALGVAGRELAGEEARLREEWELLRELAGLGPQAPPGLAELREQVRAANERLCGRIRAGEFDGAAELAGLLEVLRRAVVRKLEVANPRYLA